MRDDFNLTKTTTWSIFPAAFAIAIMVCPDMLAMVGQFFGHTGATGFVITGFSAVTYLFLLFQYQALFRHYPKTFSDFQLFRHSAGSLAAFVPLLIKITALLFLATGMLVSSGFVLNEIFIYWFPNFAFSFILLSFLITLQVLPFKILFNIQILFSCIPVAGLFILIAAGFSQSLSPEMSQPMPVFNSRSFEMDVLFIPIFFFVGMDMGFFVFSKRNDNIKRNSFQIQIAIIFMAFLFILWGITALDAVPSQTLSQTTISHILIAKAVLGDTGRRIMGTIVIFGTLAALNALLTNIRYQTHMVIKDRNFSRFKFVPALFVTGLGFIVGVLMARGLAGYDILETYISGSFILWLISYACIPVFIVIGRFQAHKNKFTFFKNLSKSLAVFLPIAISVIILIRKDFEIILTMIFMIMTISLILGFLYKNTNHAS